MIFLENADLLRVIDQEHLDYLTNANEAELDAPEQTAIEELSNHINVRYNAEAAYAADPKSALLKMYTADVLLYHLHTKAAPDNIPEKRTERYKAAISWAEKLADGFINANFPLKETKPNTTMRYGGHEKQSHYF